MKAVRQAAERMLRLLVALLALLLAAGLWLATAPAPLAMPDRPRPTADIAPFPQRIKQSATRSNQALTLQASELDLFFRAALGHLPGTRQATSQVRIEPGTLHLLASTPLSFWPARHLNLICRVTATPLEILTTRCRLGALPLPALSLAQLNGWLREGTKLWPQIDFLQQTLNGIDRIEIGADRLTLHHHIDRQQVRSIVAEGGRWLWQGIDHAAVAPYNERLRQLISQTDDALSLATALPALFRLAMERSGAAGSAQGENRAAITALALYAAGMAEPFVRDRDHPVALTLHRRSDLAQHYLLSALITLKSLPQTAEWIGLQKELNDRQASGNDFSYLDFAADLAGIRLATLATDDETGARQLQQVVSALPSDDGTLMPALKTLPKEGTHVGFDTTRHQQIESEIRMAINRLAAYRLP
ncbi:MAG TPA: hypothetical protein PLO60_08540 [Pseudomonadales bacterium]|nr:hypothetical protein [Pseudomonadales bacterium]HND27265.1 hypothetical protein [Pseudomonadales bacterium]